MTNDENENEKEGNGWADGLGKGSRRDKFTTLRFVELVHDMTPVGGCLGGLFLDT